MALPSKATRHTQAALTAALDSLLMQPQVLLSDNDAEFEAIFAQTIKARGIQRWYVYPKSPEMNAHVERFNRTVQESFVDYHENLLFTDLGLFNQKMADWLVFYNTPKTTLSTRTEDSPIFPHPTPTRVPKVVDA